MQSIYLPYGNPYSVISACHKGDYTYLGVEIRNPKNTEFSGKFELHYEIIFSRTSGYVSSCNEVKAHSFENFTLRMMQSASKIIAKLEKKLDKLNGVEYSTDPTTRIIRLIKSFTPLTEVRVHQLNEKFHGWNWIKPLNPKKDIEDIEIAVKTLVDSCTYKG